MGIAVLLGAAGNAHAATPCPGPELSPGELTRGAAEVRVYRTERARMFAPDLMGYRGGPRLGRPSRSERREIADALEVRRGLGLNTDRLLIRRLLRDSHAPVVDPDTPVTRLERRVLGRQDAFDDAIGGIQNFVENCVPGQAGLYEDRTPHDGFFLVALVTRDPEGTLTALRARYRYGDLLRVRVVRYSADQLKAVTDAIDRDDRFLRSRGIDIRSLGTDIERNRVEVGLRRPSARARALLRRRYGDVVYTDPQPTLICTLIGCTSSIGVRVKHLPAGARSVQVCSRGRCADSPVRRGYPYASVPAGSCTGGRDRVRRVVVKVFDTGGHRIALASTVVRLVKYRPNGRECPPTCWSASTTYDGSTGRLRQTPSG